MTIVDIRNTVYSEINCCTVSCSFSIKWKLFIYNFSLFTSRFILLSSYHDFILLYLTTQTYTGNTIELYSDYFAPQGYYNTNKVMSHVSFYSYISTLIHIAYRFSITYTVSVIATFVHYQWTHSFRWNLNLICKDLISALNIWVVNYLGWNEYIEMVKKIDWNKH